MASRDPDRCRKKQEIFFVDTKSTCFLCLENIEPPPSMIIDVEDKENVHMSQEEDDWRGKVKSEEQEPFCLRRIFKLLQLDPGGVLSKNRSAGPFLWSNLAATDLTVVLCRVCRQVSDELSGLFSELEVLQMKVDHSLQNFAEILNNSENDPGRTSEFRKQLFDPYDLLCGSITELMRKEALKRCTKHLQSSQPRVSVIKTQNVPLSCPVIDPVHGGPNPTSNQSKRYQCQGCKRVYTNHFAYRRHRRRHFCGSSKLASAENIHTQPFPSKENASRQMKQHYPHTQEDTPPDNQQETEQSLTTLNPWFLRLSYTCCKTCGKYVNIGSLTHHGTSCPYRTRTGSTDSNYKIKPLNVYKCQFEDCDLEFNLHGDLRDHILENHPTKAKCECGEYYTNHTHHHRVCIARRNSTPSAGSDTTTTYRKERCGCILSIGLICALHRRGTSRKISTEAFCTMCGLKLVHRNSLWRHKLFYCPYRNEAADGEGRQGRFTCYHCEVEFPLLSDLSSHIDEVHIGRDSRTRFSCEDCGKTLSHYNSLWRHRKTYCRSLNGAKTTHSGGRKVKRRTKKDEEVEIKEEPVELDLGQSSDVINSPKIEVLEAEDALFFPETEMIEETIDVPREADLINEEIYEEEPPTREERSLKQNEGGTEENVMLLLADGEDPIPLF